MNGAESLVRTLVASGIDTYFANPGTTEMHCVAVMDWEPRIRCVLALFEGVATGAADGYARIAGKPAATLLHCGPGLANGLANLHNAQRARVPLVNIVGDHATYHRAYDTPLTADVEGWARPVSTWTQTARCARTVGNDAAIAVQAARNTSGVATLILPSDVSWSEGGVPAEHAIIIDESISFGFAFYPGARDAAPHDWIQLCGGAIGEGMPLAVGASVAAPGRRVINLEGDGSSLYTIQALWTQARENLDVTTVILSNRKYAILKFELARIQTAPGRVSLDLFDLDNPTLDWTVIARGMGVEAARADTLEEFADLLLASYRRKGPFLIDLVVP
jgi:thiamine pyrophosphate-dependent acetolactate synthase large subunit-like protein